MSKFKQYIEAAKAEANKADKKLSNVEAKDDLLVDDHETDIDSLAKEICANAKKEKLIKEFIKKAKSEDYSAEDILGGLARHFKIDSAEQQDKYQVELGIRKEEKK
jgi:hypothetical protein